MSDEAPRPKQLENSRCPTAIVHEGFFVYANPAFLERLGYRSLEELESVPLLDLVAENDHDRLREHLDEAKKSAGTDRRQAEARLSFRRADDLPLAARCTGFRTRYAGEDCVQLNLVTRADEGIGGTLRSLPWKQYLSILFLLLFTVLPSTLLLRLNIDNSPNVYFPDQEPAVVLDRALHERFPNDQVFVLLFEGVALFSDGFLNAYDELGLQLLRHESIDDVVSVTEQDHIAGTADEFVVERLIDTARLSESTPLQRRQRVMDDRFANRALTSADGSALAMVVIPRGTGNSIERLALEEQILAAVKEHRLDGYLSAIAGQIPVDVSELRSMLRDNMIFIPATVTIGLTLIWWLFRRWLAVMLAGVAIGVVVNSTVAIYVLLDQPFTLISSIIPPLLSALTVAALVHLFNALHLESKRGLSGPERVSRALAEIDRPALFAALTTAGGLASLATSPIVPIKVFGLISAAGTLLIYLVVFRILPNIVARWDKHSWARVKGGARLIDSAVLACHHLALRHPLLVIILIGGALIAGAPQVNKVIVETNLQEFFDFDHPVRRDTRHIDERLIGTMPVSVTFDAPALDGLKSPELLVQIRDFQRWVEQLPQVDRSFGMVDFIEEMHWAFNAENPEFRRLPDNPQLISQYLLIYDGEDIYDFVDRDFQHAQVTLNLNIHSANEISQLLETIRVYLNEHIDDKLSWEIAGMGRLFADMEDLLVKGQVYSLWGAMVLIFVFMLFLLRSFGAAVLCMIPNLSPILLIFIIMGAAGIWLDMATAMVASVAVGIAVDDTIHVYHGFHARLQRGVSPLWALVRTYRGAGRAVMVTTLILSAQFMILMASDFVPTRNFGLLTTIGLVTALLFDLLLLPALLIIFHGANSPIGAWRARAANQAAANKEDEPEQPGLDEDYWTAERKITLVKELIGGKTSVATAAREHGVPEVELEQWLLAAEAGLSEAFSPAGGEAETEQEKVRALARAYGQLRAENRALKARQQE